jgi:hypothetical protein
MHNLGDDKELDRLSREAAGGYTPPGAPDWEALSTELDKVMPVEKKRRRVIFWWLLPVLLTGGATAYWLSQKNDTATVEQTIISQPSAKEIAPAKENTSDKKETTPAATVTTAKEQPVTAAINDPKQHNRPTTPSSLSTDVTAQQNVSKALGRKNTEPANNTFTTMSKVKTTKNNTSNNNTNNNEASKASEQFVQKETAALTNDPSKENTAVTVTTAKEAETKQSNTVQAQVENNDAAKENKTEPAISPDPTPAAETAAPKKEAIPLKPRGKGISFGIIAGVDESTVKFKYGNNAGYNIGVAAGYHFSNKLSVHTGAIFTEKKYKVAGPDFTAPKGTIISYYKLEDVDGYCRMWEFPLLVRYNISQGKRNNVFLSTGLSSYYMTKENYNYTYYNNLCLLATRNSEYASHDTHIMSILHLSAGFENRMNKNLSLIIEPYAKLPLGGVGFGNIMLSSFGLNFSVQYRQPAKK